MKKAILAALLATLGMFSAPAMSADDTSAMERGRGGSTGPHPNCAQNPRRCQ